jgi:zinc/manganese transport system permease protein
MSEIAEIMFKPLLACLLISAIHVYLGLHVVDRGIIFVDLALAQVAACGATAGFLLGYSLHSAGSYFASLVFTLAAAAVFSFFRSKRQRLPQEALIGVVYAVAASLAIIILSKAPEGGEELKSLLVGHLLFVGWPELIKLCVLYALVAIVLFLVHPRLRLISLNPESAFKHGLNVKWWDFLFYALFALVVTNSVEIAGVLLVFSFLVIPALCAMLFSSKTWTRLLIGWGGGVTASVLGMLASYAWDIPTGASVVCVFALVLLLSGLGAGVLRGKVIEQ